MLLHVFNVVQNWWDDIVKENGYDAENSGKMVLLLDILTLCSDIGDKALIFSQSLSTLDLIEHHISKLTRNAKDQKCWKKGKDWYRCVNIIRCKGCSLFFFA